MFKNQSIDPCRDFFGHRAKEKGIIDLKVRKFAERKAVCRYVRKGSVYHPSVNGEASPGCVQQCTASMFIQGRAAAHIHVKRDTNDEKMRR